MIENIRLAYIGIISHKLRSILTMLGIIIGIAALMAIVSSIRGTNERIKENMLGDGTNTVKVSLYNGDSEYEPDGWGDSSNAKPPLLTAGQKAQVMTVPHVANATFYYSTTSENVYYGKTAFYGGTLLGIDQNYLATNELVIRQGRPFVQKDYDDYRKVCLLDGYAVESLFPGENPLGKVLDINSDTFIVVGVYNEKNSFTQNIKTYDDYSMSYSSVVGTLLVPYPLWPIVSGFDKSQNLIIKADTTDNMSKASSDVAQLLNTFLPSGKSRSSSERFEYKADNIMERIRSQQQLNQSTSAMLIVVAGISLLVGGIGVANIMLVSVTERTGEIGLKKAIGAKKSTIMAQFLTEAAVLTSMGGLIGVLGGIGLAYILSAAMDTPVFIDLGFSALAVGFSMLIGIVSGLFPSMKAANLDPIEALRSE